MRTSLRFAACLLFAMLVGFNAGASFADSFRIEVPEDVKDGFLAVRDGPGLGHNVIGSLLGGTINVMVSDCQFSDDGGRSTKKWCRLEGSDDPGRWVSSCCIIGSNGTLARLGNPRGWMMSFNPQTHWVRNCSEDFTQCGQAVIKDQLVRNHQFAFALFKDGVRATAVGGSVISHYCKADWREFVPPGVDNFIKGWSCKATVSGPEYKVFVRIKIEEGEAGSYDDQYVFTLNSANETCMGLGRFHEEETGAPIEVRWSEQCPITRAES